MSQFTKLSEIQSRMSGSVTQLEKSLLILFDFGKVNYVQIGGYGVYAGEEVLFWNAADKFHIFKVSDTWRDKIKDDQREFRTACGFTSDYGPIFAKRFEFDDEKLSDRPYMRSYQMGDIEAVYLGYVTQANIINYGQCDTVAEKYLKYFDQ